MTWGKVRVGPTAVLDDAPAEPALYPGYDMRSGSPSTMYCRDFASRSRTAAIFT
jgi:hypothetical protein